jgi:hypothetical protein
VRRRSQAWSSRASSICSRREASRGTGERGDRITMRPDEMSGRRCKRARRWRKTCVRPRCDRG